MSFAYDVGSNFLANLVAGWMGDIRIGFALGILALLWIVVSWHRRQRRKGLPGVQMHHFLMAGIIGTWLCLTATLGAAAWMIWTRQGFSINSADAARGTNQSSDGPMQWYRNLILEGGPPLGRNVFSLTFNGGNISQKEVALKSASIISSINGIKIPLEIVAQGDIVPLDQIELIPPGAPVRLVAKFGPPDPNAPGKLLGLEPKVFLDTWRQFSFNAQDDTKAYRILFNEGDLASFFPGMVGPHVSKKAQQHIEK